MCCVTSVLTLSARGPTLDVNSDYVAPNWDTKLIHVPCQIKLIHYAVPSLDYIALMHYVT